MSKKTTANPIRAGIAAELRDLKSNGRKVRRDLRDAERAFTKHKQAFAISKRNCKAALNRIERRASILNGRLAA